MRRSKKANAEAFQIAHEAVKIGHEATEYGMQSIERMKAVADEAMSITREALTTATGAIALMSAMREKVKTLPNGEILSGDELQALAEMAPQWDITSGMVDGEAVKTYHRVILESELPIMRRAGERLGHETYKKLADMENSDFQLAQIFGSYYVDGDFVNGKYYDIRIHSNEPGPITYNDFERVLDAEDYLIDAGYILPPVTAATSPSL